MAEVIADAMQEFIHAMNTLIEESGWMGNWHDRAFEDIPPVVPSEHAEKKASALLKASLNPYQLATWEIAEAFLIVAPSGNTYILRNTKTWTLEAVVKCGNSYMSIAYLCAFPDTSEGMPHDDGIYQIKTMLEAVGGEEAYIRAANIQIMKLPERCETHVECHRMRDAFLKTYLSVFPSKSMED